MAKATGGIVFFFKEGIWKVEKGDVPAPRFLLYTIIKKLILAVECFTTRRMMHTSAALTYSTLLAIVPILAVVFAIARGFGYNKYIETWFLDALSSQPQVAEALVDFVNSYLIHTKSGIFLGLGLLFMLWTVIMLLSNIEEAFNKVWQVKKPRSPFRTITDYMGMFLLAPIVIVVTSGFSIFVATFGDNGEVTLLRPIAHFLVDVMPFVLMSAVFIALYLFMPNTKVKLKSVIVPGLFSGVAMQGLQLCYIHSQIWVSSYNAIYGSFAALPLFMLWVQISWAICLFGAELCYANQNLEAFAVRRNTYEISPRYRLWLSAVLLGNICKRFAKGGKPYTALELKLLTGIPIRITQDLLYTLAQLGLVSEITGDEKSDESVYQPAMDLSLLTMGVLIDRMENDGVPLSVLDTDFGKNPAWLKAMSIHKQYLIQEREILLKDL